jgi:hypothetical protein
MSTEAPSALERWLKIAGVSVTLLGLIAGAYQLTATSGFLFWLIGLPGIVRVITPY